MPDTILHKHLIRAAENGKPGYQYTDPMVTLLSKVSGVNETIIGDTILHPRTPLRYIPFYPANKRGGAITLGNHKKHSITFTENFFSDNQALFGNAAYANKTATWLRLSAHEVGHLAHAHRYRSLIVYLIDFIYQYLRYGHDAAPLEQEADIGPLQLRRFSAFVNKKNGDQSIIKLLESKLTASSKVNQILLWWSDFESTAT